MSVYFYNMLNVKKKLLSQYKFVIATFGYNEFGCLSIPHD